MRAVVFVLRGCSAGWLGAYGNEWVVTPNLDRLAAEGVVFDRHISDCPDADAARRAWLTGRFQVPPLEDAPALPAADSGSRLHEALRDVGVHTVLVRANHPDTDAPAPFYAAWGEVFDARPRPDDDSPLDALVRSFPSLLDRLGTVPRWLVWVETDRLLPPWDVPPAVFDAYLGDAIEDDDVKKDDEGYEDDVEDVVKELIEPEEPVTPFADPPTGPFDTSDPAAWEWLRTSYAAVVTALDADLGKLFDELRPRGLDQTAAWVVTSDHGYPLGEHGHIGPHRPWLHEELVHLPLVVRLPGAAEAGRRVPALTQPPDLAATLLDLFNVEAPPADLHGQSLVPLARGAVETVRPYAYSGLVWNSAGEWAIRTAEWTYLLPARPHPDDVKREPVLFETPDDRWEVIDLASQNRERLLELDNQLRKLLATK